MALRYFFAYCVFTLCQVTGLPTKYALLGKDVNFVADIKTASDDIMWRHNGNKVVEFNGQMQQQYDSFKGRAILDRHSADLNITNLRYEDSGRYDLKIYINNIMKSLEFDLEVIDSIAKPNISCEMNDGGSSGKTGGGATLMCSAESKQSQSLLEFEWNSDGNKQVGPKLIIPLGDVHDKQVYNCTVSNPLTTESATFIAKECYSDKSISTPVIIGICVGSFLILVIFVVIYKFYKGKCGRVTKSDVESQSDQDKTAGSDEDREEKQGLIDRAPTMPSHQPLRYLNQKPTHNDSEKTIQDLRTPLNSKKHPPGHLEDKRKSTAPPVAETSGLVGELSRRLTAKNFLLKPSAAVERKAPEPAASAEADVTLPGCDKQSSEERRIESSASSSSGKCHDLPTNEQGDENKSGETGNKDPEPDPAHSETSDYGSEERRIESSASSSSGKCHDLPTNEQADENKSGETGNKDPEPDPAHSKTSDNDSDKKMIDSSLSAPSGKSSHTHPTKKEADEDEPGETGENKGPQPDPAVSKTSDPGLEENGAKKDMGIDSSRSSAPENPLQTRDFPTNTQAAEDKPGETGDDPAESGTGGTNPGEKENVATSEDDAPSQKPEAKPCSHLGSETPPGTKGETSSDQAAGDVPQPPLTTTNPAQEALQGGNQALEAETPDGHRELDHPPDTAVVTRSSSVSESVNSNTETSLKPPDVEKKDPDLNGEIRLNSEGSGAQKK
uniref:Serine/arginine repetitive matrix protein 1-like n=1 Tax=Nothobranchius furzeri TaxID=105023 RepID=A0A8C6NQE3_NOTFU